MLYGVHITRVFCSSPMASNATSILPTLPFVLSTLYALFTLVTRSARDSSTITMLITRAFITMPCSDGLVSPEISSLRQIPNMNAVREREYRNKGRYDIQDLKTRSEDVVNFRIADVD